MSLHACGCPGEAPPPPAARGQQAGTAASAEHSCGPAWHVQGAGLGHPAAATPLPRGPPFRGGSVSHSGDASGLFVTVTRGSVRASGPRPTRLEPHGQHGAGSGPRGRRWGSASPACLCDGAGPSAPALEASRPRTERCPGRSVLGRHSETATGRRGCSAAKNVPGTVRTTHPWPRRAQGAGGIQSRARDAEVRAHRREGTAGREGPRGAQAASAHPPCAPALRDRASASLGHRPLSPAGRELASRGQVLAMIAGSRGRRKVRDGCRVVGGPAAPAQRRQGREGAERGAECRTGGRVSHLAAPAARPSVLGRRARHAPHRGVRRIAGSSQGLWRRGTRPR